MNSNRTIRSSLMVASLLAMSLPVLAADSPDFSKAVSPPPTAVEVAPALEAGVIYLVQGEKLQKLEAIPMDMDRSVGGLGLLASVATLSDMTGEQFWGVLDGPASELRLTEPQPRFRIREEKAKALSIRLGKFVLAGKKRRARTDEKKPVDFFDGKYRVEITATKMGEGTWDLTPAKPLKAGEYGLALTSRGPVVDFAAVGASKASKD